MMNEMKKMKTLTLQGIPFEVVDEAARNDIESVKDTLENLPKNEIVTPDLAQNDSTAPDYVKNRTHYEETAVVNEPLNITWDGNTEGLVRVGDEEGYYYKVSNAILTDEQIKTAKLCMSQNPGQFWDVSELWEEFKDSPEAITEDFVCLNELVFVRKKGGVTIYGFVFPEEGVYFSYVNSAQYVTDFITTEPVEQTKTVVKKLDKKYLPDDVGGSVTVFYVDDTECLCHDKEMTMKVSKDEYRLALSSGVVTIATTDGYSVYYPSYTDFGYDYAKVSLWDDGDWWIVHTSEYTVAPPA